MRNPVMTASGTFGYGSEYADFVDLNQLGAVVVKGVTSVPWPGNPMQRIMETPSGMLNAIGLQNVGVDGFISEKLPYLRDFDVPVIVNVCGKTVEEYLTVIEKLNTAAGVAGVELNISCPNLDCGRYEFRCRCNAGTSARQRSQSHNTPTAIGETLPKCYRHYPNCTRR